MQKVWICHQHISLYGQAYGYPDNLRVRLIVLDGKHEMNVYCFCGITEGPGEASGNILAGHAMSIGFYECVGRGDADMV